MELINYHALASSFARPCQGSVKLSVDSADSSYVCFAFVAIVSLTSLISILMLSRDNPADMALLKIPFLNSLQASLSAR